MISQQATTVALAAAATFVAVYFLREHLRATEEALHEARKAQAALIEEVQALRAASKAPAPELKERAPEPAPAASSGGSLRRPAPKAREARPTRARNAGAINLEPKLHTSTLS